MLIEAKFDPEAELDDWVIRTTVVLVEFAAPLPAFFNTQLAEKLAPGVTVDGVLMLCGTKSD